jgi:predicted dinucleotide-binding enzyme
MNIGIIGAGWLGGTVGKVWLKAGHDLLFSSRHLEKPGSAPTHRGEAELRRALGLN